MGVSTNIHIGPYLVAEGKKIVDVDELVNTCCNEKCVNYISNKEVKSKFCASCGSSANTPKKFTVATEVQANDYLSSICSDDLCYTDPMGGTGGIFISNKRSPYDLKFDEYEEEIDLTDVDMEKQMQWFKDTHKNIIEKLIDEYGPDSAIIKWGVVRWYS